MVERFVLKLRHATHLSERDEGVLNGLVQPLRRIEARCDALLEGEKPRGLLVIKEGWACRYRVLEDGKRQIFSLILPGDLCEPFGVLPRFNDHSLSTLTGVAVASISLSAIGAAARESPAINEALWWDLLVAWNIEREHIISLGRRSAVERMGHLICELHLRLEMVGLADGASYDLPVTQTDLADVLGLSTVHVNRSLQELRRVGFISLSGRRMIIHDLQGLKQFSFFDAGYLHPRVSSALRTDTEEKG